MPNRGDVNKYARHVQTCKKCLERNAEWAKLCRETGSTSTGLKKPVTYWHCSQGYKLLKKAEK